MNYENLLHKVALLFFLAPFFSSAVYADTLVLKNGNMIPCVVRNFSEGSFSYEAEGKISTIKRELVESVLMTDFLTGVYGNDYKNYSFRFTITKPDKWFFIPNQSMIGDNLVVISRTSEPKITDMAMIVSVHQLTGNIGILEDVDFRKEVERELRKKFPDFIRFPPEIKPLAGTRAIFQQATVLIPYLGEMERYMIKQVAIPWTDRIFVFTVRDKMANYSRNEPDFDFIINSMEFMDRTDIFGNLGYLFMMKKEFRTGARYFEEAIKLYPNEADLYNKLGMCYGMTGRYDDAIKAFKSSLKLNPALDEARYNLENTSSYHYSGTSM